ncbi:endonuclease domain-containing 1 protein-like [Ictalurus furcatus]|uniref:endonuclease domain-containing 1 protein-like n=1 Tax=Ictalurus furcatus TaxID=66913 RepID=UPI00235015A7|nr:endonuclease domain-containing 1 protein-like [Ictalurus furcatus]
MRFVPLLLSALLSLGDGDVGDFTPCLNFFYRARPPTGIAGTPICQRYSNRYHFATLYSRERRTPWFSGYVFSCPHGKRPRGEWKYEPQLANSKAGGNMVPFPTPPAKVDQNVVDSQAVQKDYTNSTYTRGHLNPSQHHNGTDVRRATFTLTNVVPQKSASNDGPWAKLENRVSKILSEYCLGEAYIVTGVIPYENDHWLKDEGRVAIPEYMWSAYCCQNYSQDLPKGLNDIFPTFGAIGRNDPNSTQEIVPVDLHKKKEEQGYDVRSMSLPILEGYLKEKYRMSISVFDQQCSRA